MVHHLPNTSHNLSIPNAQPNKAASQPLPLSDASIVHTAADQTTGHNWSAGRKTPTRIEFRLLVKTLPARLHR